MHDKERPYPPVVTPGSCSHDTQVGKAPSDAIILFDGKDLSKWKNKNWIVANGAMKVNKGKQSSLDQFGSIQLHIEWATPDNTKSKSQGRGNSGVFLMGLYEIQILDSYDNQTYADGQAAAVYGQKPPAVNACKKPGEWQSYDIIFIAPIFENEKCIQPARVTVFHNGILVHHNVKIHGPTKHQKVTEYKAHGEKGPLVLQDHKNPVRYRNIWVRPLTGRE